MLQTATATMVTMQFDWASHTHILKYAADRGSDCYSGIVDGEACVLCNEASRQAGLPEKEHFKHPKGCQCYWCVFCKCPEVTKRDRATS